MGTVTYLQCPVYVMRDVDQLLGLTPGTARRWIDGYRRHDRDYPPIVRPVHTGEDEVTWGEFVEARFLAEFREAGTRIYRLRRVVAALREHFGALYPLAEAQPWLGENLEVVYDIQTKAGVDEAVQVVDAISGQFYLTPPVEHFRASTVLERIDDRPIVARLVPVEGGPVIIDPLIRSGSPVVRAVPTDLIAELYRAGDAIEDIADWYRLSEDEVRAALAYEHIDVAA